MLGRVHVKVCGDSPGGGSSGKDAVEEEAVARTTRTEKTSDGGRTTTTTTTTTHKTKGRCTLTNFHVLTRPSTPFSAMLSVCHCHGFLNFATYSVHIVSSRQLRISLHAAKCSFYRVANSTFGKLDRIAPE